MHDRKEYQAFLATKKIRFEGEGTEIDVSEINDLLFPFQRDLVAWAVRKGRAAVFADTGLGKTFIQLEWARLIGGRTLIVAPLSVARQTMREAAKLGIDVAYVRSQEGAEDGPQIVTTNYEMIQRFDPSKFDAVVLDESSILKSLDGKTRRKATDMFALMKYRLCCTATPAPNDIGEIANHSEFLGVMDRSEMLAAFFVHDDQGWRLRGYAEDAFYRWMASWSMSIKKPSDLGYDDDGFVLPPLNTTHSIVETNYVPEGELFFTGLKGIQDRASARKASCKVRVAKTVEIVGQDSQQWVIWCGLNDESTQITRAIPDAVEVKGSDSLDYKIDMIEKFQDGQIRVLVTKTKIAGFGMNLQNCHNMVFLGLNDSWESYYQAVRRCYRFGQTHSVNVHIVISNIEREILTNIQTKERRADNMSQRLINHVQAFEREELHTEEMEISGNDYAEDIATGDDWRLMLGDSVERMEEVEDDTVGLSVFSPPFMDLYTYSPTERDLGNSASERDFFEHFGYIIDQLLRVTQPGRNCCVHSADIPALLQKDGYIGLKDFPGKVIQAFEARGWIYHGRVTIDKNPQAQAIRTHSKGLLFVQMEKDSIWSRPAVADYILIFRKPGENQHPVKPVENEEITRDKWIEWAHPIWYGIRESDTLQYSVARSGNDDKHICPLQLGTIERCIALWSNPGDVVFSPFAGIGSEVYQAVKMGRHAVGIELKQSYFQVAVQNARKAEHERAITEADLFSEAAV